MSSTGPVSGSSPIQQVDISKMDLESAMMYVQSQRAEALESQLKGQLSEIQKRNETISRLNDVLGKLKNSRPDGEDPKATGQVGSSAEQTNEILKTLRETGAENVPSTVAQDPKNEIKLQDGTVYKNLDAKGMAEAEDYKKKDWAFRSDDYSGAKRIVDIKDTQKEVKVEVSQGQMDKWVETLKGKIDSLNSSQQMDMLRMQSLTNKRNEAFDLMSNFIKKMSDGRSSIIGNMR